jgi:8-oxo-dGTP pyrophosphatase MutT (NUDIX family)
MVKHKHDNVEYYCSPGGGIEDEETPEQAAIRELKEECNVDGKIIKKTSEYVDPYDDNNFFYTFYMDIGDQVPFLGYDPELSSDDQILSEIRWLSLDELTEVDRAYLWAAGLLSIACFAAEMDTWSRVISYPTKI